MSSGEERGVNSAERVALSARHQEPDRVPMHIWYTPQIGAQLAELYGVSGVVLETQIGNDILMTHVGVNRGFDAEVEPGEEYADDWGIRYRRVFHYNEVVGNPLAEAEELANYDFPIPALPARWQALDGLLAQYGSSHCIAADMSSNLFEIGFHLRGMERWLTDLVSDPRLVEELLERLQGFDLEVARLAVKRQVGVVWLGSDIASQRGMIISPALWRRLFKPRMAQLIAAIKGAAPQMLVAYHSCGAIRPVIPDLIEVGVDILNPIQPLAKDMSPREIKRDFGAALTLHGALDVQQLMPYGTPAQVRDQVCRLMDALAPGGGYIFGPAHALQPDVPLANIEAMLSAAREYGVYR
jgi:uroporphyrinogen decarboxylase